MKFMHLLYLTVSSIIYINAVEIDSNEDQLPIGNEYRFHRKLIHGISDPGAPWITGPNNKKYQFHVGRQSWLAAREHCLAQNSDLVTISSAKELDWILDHYSPQFPNLRDRLVQIGLLIDSHDGMREWKWVNKKPLSHDIISWISGEPFDHAEGRERCAILRVNEISIDDVDCDLPGSMTMMYRFVCERTHEEHVKHEEVNNPLWKKLQDILDFFGISGGQEDNENEKNSTREGEEDYFEVMKNSTLSSSSNPDERSSEIKEEIVSSTNANSEDVDGSGIEDNEVAKTTAAVVPHAKGAKTLDKSLLVDELLLNDNLEKINNKQDTSDVVLLETASIETTRTTKADPLEKLSSSDEKFENAYVDVLEKNMEKLEKIVSAVEKMIDPLEGINEETRKSKSNIIPKEKKHKQADSNPSREIQTNENVAIFNSTTTNPNNEINEGNEKEMVEAMENDFDEAEQETLKHPNVNSSDIISPTNSEKTELCENENEKTLKIEKFLKTLHRFLNRSSANDLKELVDESKKNGTSLLERLNQSISKATEKEIEKMKSIEKSLNESLIFNKDEDDENKKQADKNEVTSEIPINEINQSKVQISSLENEKNISESTTVIGSSSVTTPAAETERISNNGVETASPVSELKSYGNNNSNFTTEKDQKHTDEKNGDLANANQATIVEKNEVNTIEVKEDKEQNEKGDEITLTIHLPKKEVEFPKFNDNVEERNENKNVEKRVNNEIKEKSKEENFKIDPKSRGDGLSSKADKSVFPTPRFDLLKPEQLKKIPTEISKAIEKEAKNINKIYDDFNKRIDTSSLIKRIEENEKRRLNELKPLPIATTSPKITLAPTHDEAEKKAMRELEALFEDLGRNFQQIVQG